MPLSTRAPFEVGPIGRVKGGSVCLDPDLSCDLINDDFDMNKSYPSTKRPTYTKNRAASERCNFPWLLRGAWLIWMQM